MAAKKRRVRAPGRVVPEALAAPARPGAAPQAPAAPAANPPPALAPAVAALRPRVGAVVAQVAEPVLVPSIPDQTNYAGRHYLDLVIDQSQFVPQVSVDRNGNVITAQNVPSALQAPQLNQPGDTVAMLNRVTGTTTIASGEVLQAPSAAAQLAAAKDALPASIRVVGGAGVPALRSVRGAMPVQGSGGGIIEPSGFGVYFTAPLPGQVFGIAGGSFNLTVTLDVIPSDSRANAPINCTLRLDGAAVPITGKVDSSGTKTYTSNAPLNFNASGAHTLVANATQASFSATATCNFTVNLQAGAGGGPVSGLLLTITSPADGTVIASQTDPSQPAEAIVNFTGSAAVPAGAAIQSLTVQIDGDGATASNAVPDPSAGWKSWSAEQALLAFGTHTALVTLTDSDGNSVAQNVGLVLAPYAPRLWLYSKLLIIEELRLTNYAGQYGRGKVLKTFSLLPGEQTTISVSSYLTDTSTTTNTTSIFDELDDKTSSDFDSSVADEQTDKQASQDSTKWGIEASASASWGWGSANIKGDYKSDSNSSRENLRKNVTSATNKHAAERSSRRSVQVNAENTQTVATGSTQSIQRQISNINVSRTLNFVFYQLNQEYISLLHLVDVRLGYVSVFLSLVDSSTQFEYQEYNLNEIPVLLSRAITESAQVDVSGHIDDVLNNVVDFNSVRHGLRETVTPTDETTNLPAPEASYLRFKRSLSGTWIDQATGIGYSVGGVLLGVNKVTMRTDGVLVDSVLGQNTALDSYNTGLQAATLTQRNIANAAAQQVVDLVNNPNAAQLGGWVQTHPQSLPATLSIAATNPPAIAGAGPAGG